MDLAIAGWENTGMGFKFQMGMRIGWDGNVNVNEM